MQVDRLDGEETLLLTDSTCSDEEDESAREIILDSSFVENPCLSSVYEQAGEAAAFQNILQNFDGEFSVAHLKLSASSDISGNAVTKPPSNYIIDIEFNTNRLNRPELSVARTLIHELIHAEMWRKLLSLAGKGELNYDNWTTAEQVNFVYSIRDNFPGIYDYYRNYKNWHHEQMAGHYLNIIEQGLRQYNSAFSNEIYEALAWVGLRGEGGINGVTGLTEYPTTAWENLDQERRLELIDLNNLFKESNPNCQ